MAANNAMVPIGPSLINFDTSEIVVSQSDAARGTGRDPQGVLQLTWSTQIKTMCNNVIYEGKVARGVKELHITYCVQDYALTHPINTRYEPAFIIKFIVEYGIKQDNVPEGQELNPMYYDSKYEVFTIFPDMSSDTNPRSEITLSLSQDIIKSIDVIFINNMNIPTDQQGQYIEEYIYVNYLTVEPYGVLTEDKVKEITEDNFKDNYDKMANQTGTYIEVRTSDPTGTDLYAGRIWLREDLV